MDRIKETFEGLIEKATIEIKEFLKEHGDEKVGDVTIAQMYGCLLYTSPSPRDS